MRRRRESEFGRPIENGVMSHSFSRHESLAEGEITPALLEITSIYEKVKNGRVNEIYRFSTHDTHAHQHDYCGEDDTIPMEPSFGGSNHPPSPTAPSPSVRFLEFNKYAGLPIRKYLYFSASTNTIQSDTLEGLAPNYTKLLKSKFYWLNITDPNESDLAILFNSFNVHDFTISDIRETNTEEKIEFYQHYTFMSTRLLRVFKLDDKEEENSPPQNSNSNADFTTDAETEVLTYHDQDPRKCVEARKRERGGHGHAHAQAHSSRTGKGRRKPVDMDFNILLFKNFVITMHDKKWASINDILGFVNLVSTETPLTPDWVLYSIFIELAQDAHYLLSGIEPRINELRILGTKNTKEMSRVLQENYEMEFQLYAIERFLKPKVNILRTLKLKCGRRFGRMLLKLLNEIRDDFVETNYDLRNLNHMLERSQDTFLALVSVEKSREANEMSLIMERLSQIALIFLPIQAISGFFGMNVIVPWQNEDSAMYFWLLVVISFVFGTIMYLCKSFILNKFKCSGDDGEGRSGKGKPGCCGGRRRKHKQLKRVWTPKEV